ncbi:MAG: hypothetical protein ACTSP3_02470 [Candidatus Heimdallarchaeaceae archaeon]
MIIMEKKVKLQVNGKKIPLNSYLTNLTAKLVLSIVQSLKGIDDEIKEISLEIKYDSN